MESSSATARTARSQTIGASSILIVDADADTRALYRECFANDVSDIIEAADGREALAKALMRPPTLVVTEVALPFMNGYALCDILRQDHTTAHVRILIVTAAARAIELDRARRAGADAVLVKPTTPEAIVSEMRRLLSDGPRGREPLQTAADTAVPLPSEPAGTRPNRRRALVKQHQRFATATPPSPPPTLMCPACDRPLKYEQSQIGGVSTKHAEQWDYFTCPTCGTFQYRQRTRKLRRVS